MWYHWLIFGLVLVLIPISFGYCKITIVAKQSLTEQQKKKVDLITGKYILLFWLYDLLYMSIFNKWLVWEYVFGVIAVVVIFTNLIRAFLSENKLIVNLLPFDLLLGVVLSVYLIYILPNPQLQTIMTAVVSAVYGGILTLVGVAWTIRHANKQNQESERKAIKPIIYSISRMSDYNHKEQVDILFAFGESSKESTFVGIIKNSDNGIFIVKEAIVNDRTCPIHHPTVLDKNIPAQVIILASEKLVVESMVIVGTDVQGNVIKYELHLTEGKKDIAYMTEIIS